MTTLIELYKSQSLNKKWYDVDPSTVFSDDICFSECPISTPLPDLQLRKNLEYLVCEKATSQTPKEKSLWILSVEDVCFKAIGYKELKEWIKERRFHYPTDEEITQVMGDDFDPDEYCCEDDEDDEVFAFAQKEAREYYLKQVEDGTFNGFDKFTDESCCEDCGCGEFILKLEIIGMLKPV